MDKLAITHPNIVESMKEMAKEKRDRNTKAKTGIIDLLEKIEVTGEVKLEEFPNRSLSNSMTLTRKLPNKSTGSNPAPIPIDFSQSDLRPYQDIRFEIDELKDTVVNLSDKLEWVFNYVSSTKSSSVTHLPPIQQKRKIPKGL